MKHMPGCFEKAIRNEFAFLADYGFTETESAGTIMRYSKDDVAISIYHGRGSFELGMHLCVGEEQFSLAEIIGVADPVAGSDYRNTTATTTAALESGIRNLAEQFRQDGQRALQNDADLFIALRKQRKAWGEAYELDVLAEQTRPKAEAAFREGRYREAATLYEKIAARLSATERAKLALARKRR